MIGKRRFYVGQRVRPSRYGVERNVFLGTWRGVKRSKRSGVIVRVDEFNSPTVLWNGTKTPVGYHPDFIAPDTRRKTKR